MGDIAKYSHATDAQFKILLNFQIAFVTPARAVDCSHSPSIESSSNGSMTSWPRSKMPDTATDTATDAAPGGPCIWEHRIQAHSTAGAPTAEHGGEINTVGQSVTIQVTASGSPSRQHERKLIGIRFSSVTGECQQVHCEAAVPCI